MFGKKKDPGIDVLEKIKSAMDDRIGERLKPKAMAVDIHAEGKPPEGSPKEELSESPAVEMKEDGPGVASEVSNLPGIENLSPEEKDELIRLYSKLSR